MLFLCADSAVDGNNLFTRFNFQFQLALMKCVESAMFFHTLRHRIHFALHSAIIAERLVYTAFEMTRERQRARSTSWRLCLVVTRRHTHHKIWWALKFNYLRGHLSGCEIGILNVGPWTKNPGHRNDSTSFFSARIGEKTDTSWIEKFPRRHRRRMTFELFFSSL